MELVEKQELLKIALHLTLYSDKTNSQVNITKWPIHFYIWIIEGKMEECPLEFLEPYR